MMTRFGAISRDKSRLLMSARWLPWILVYAKPDYAAASFTILNFAVDDIDQAVDELTARGVPIQRHEGFDTDDRGIYRGERRSIARFTDPAGNVLSIVQQT
jgi:predicted enzyme related to lactoylglutathione lyase